MREGGSCIGNGDYRVVDARRSVDRRNVDGFGDDGNRAALNCIGDKFCAIEIDAWVCNEKRAGL